jgi:hypothetical protein
MVPVWLVRAVKTKLLEGFQTASRFRPLARRRLMTALPALDFILTRKPWVR